MNYHKKKIPTKEKEGLNMSLVHKKSDGRYYVGDKQIEKYYGKEKQYPHTGTAGIYLHCTNHQST